MRTEYSDYIVLMSS